MATQKRAYTFYADADIDGALQELPSGSRGRWINQMIRTGSAHTSIHQVSPLDEAREVWADMNKRIKRLEQLAERQGAY